MFDHMFCYKVFHDGIEEHTSQLFKTLKEAIEFFQTQDAPNHYKAIKFKRSHAVSSCLTGTNHIRVQFFKVSMRIAPFNEFDEIVKD